MLKDEINKLLGDKAKDLKNLLIKFGVIPPVDIPVTPVAQAAPPAPQAPQAPAQLQESPLEDGTTIKYDTPTLAVGSIVTVVGPEGELPAPEGEIKLKDGTVIMVVKKDGNSVVESVTPAQAPVDAPAPVLQNQAPAPSPNLQPILNQMASLKAEKDEIKKQFEAFKKEVAEDFKSFLTIMQPILDAPSAAPVEPPANKFSKGKPNSVLNKILNQ